MSHRNSQRSSARPTHDPCPAPAAPGDRQPLSRDSLLPLVLRRTPFQHEQVPFIVCWSQKSGCTSVLKWFLFHAGLLDKALQHQELNLNLEIHNYENNVFKARAGYKEDLVDQIMAGKPLVKFLRCPYERLFSSFMHLNNTRFLLLQDEGQTTPGMLLRQDILEFIYGKPTDIDQPISFPGYLAWLQAQEPATLDPHHAPQVSPLDEAVPASYYRLEDFDHACRLLEKKFSLRSSSAARRHFTSVHHHQKRRTSMAAALRFLSNPPMLSQFSKARIPRITRSLLRETAFDPQIRQLLAGDIALYNSARTTRWYDRLKLPGRSM